MVMRSTLLSFDEFINESWVWGKQIPDFPMMLDLIFKEGSDELRYPELLRDKVYPAIARRGTLMFKARYPDAETLEKALIDFKVKREDATILKGEARVVNRFLVLCVLLMVHSQCRNRELSPEDIAKDRVNVCLTAYDTILGEDDSVLQGFMLLATGKWDGALSEV
jgi:hypothetical protein